MTHKTIEAMARAILMERHGLSAEDADWTMKHWAPLAIERTANARRTALAALRALAKQEPALAALVEECERDA